MIENTARKCFFYHYTFSSTYITIENNDKKIQLAKEQWRTKYDIHISSLRVWTYADMFITPEVAAIQITKMNECTSR